MDQLIFLDKEFTLFLNSLHTPGLDAVFYLFTSRVIWIPLYLSLLWLVFKRQGPGGIMTVAIVGLIILLSDQITSSVMKPLFERLRPTHDDVLQYMVHTVAGYRGGLYGFASSHAANTFALFAFFTLVVRSWAISLPLGAYALINCYGRIYQGVHFFGDILVGAIVGILIARLVYELYLRLALHFFVINHHNKWTLKTGLARMFGTAEPLIVALTFVLTVVVGLIALALLGDFYGAALR